MPAAGRKASRDGLVGSLDLLPCAWALHGLCESRIPDAISIPTRTLQLSVSRDQ
jgi:hypothetical protein